MFYLLILLFIIILALAFLVFKQYQKTIEMDQMLKDHRADPGRWTFADAQLIANASQNADKIVSEAEVLALKLATEKIMEGSLFEDSLKQKFESSFDLFSIQLQKNFQQIEGGLNINLIQAQKKHDEFLVQLEKQSVTWSNRIQDELQSKVSGLLFDFEQKLTDFFAGAEQKSLDAITLEIKSARQLIDSYKSEQLSIIDENIVAVLERTLNLVLSQKLSLKEQVDMVYEALERAKLEKFLA